MVQKWILSLTWPYGYDWRKDDAYFSYTPDNLCILRNLCLSRCYRIMNLNTRAFFYPFMAFISLSAKVPVEYWRKSRGRSEASLSCLCPPLASPICSLCRWVPCYGAATGNGSVWTGFLTCADHQSQPTVCWLNSRKKRRNNHVISFLR